MWEPPSQLYCMRARWYDPEKGRFIFESDRPSGRDQTIDMFRLKSAVKLTVAMVALSRPLGSASCFIPFVRLKLKLAARHKRDRYLNANNKN